MNLKYLINSAKRVKRSFRRMRRHYNMFLPCGGLFCMLVLLQWLHKLCRGVFCGGYVNVVLANSSFFFNFYFFIFLSYFFVFLFFKKNKQIFFLFSTVLVFLFFMVLYKQYTAIQHSDVGFVFRAYTARVRKVLNAFFDFSGPGLLHGISFLLTCCFFFYNSLLFNFKTVKQEVRFFSFFHTKLIILFAGGYVLLTGAYWAFFSAIWGNWYNNDIIEVYYVVFFIASAMFLHTCNKPYEVYKFYLCFFITTIFFLTLLRFGVLNTKHTNSPRAKTTSVFWVYSLSTLVVCFYISMFYVGLKTQHTLSSLNRNIDAWCVNWFIVFNSFIWFFFITIALVFFPKKFLFFYFFFMNFFLLFFLLLSYTSFTRFYRFELPTLARWKGLHNLFILILTALVLFVWGVFVVEKIKPRLSTPCSVTNYFKTHTHITLFACSHTNTTPRFTATTPQTTTGQGFFKLEAAFHTPLSGLLSGGNKQQSYRKLNIIAPYKTINKDAVCFSVKNQTLSKAVSFFKSEYDLLFFLFSWIVVFFLFL